MPVYLAAILLIALAVFRQPVGQGNVRPWLCDIFLLGTLLFFALFLWSKVSGYAALFLVLAYVSSLWPAKTQYSQQAIALTVSGVAFYAFAMILFENNKELIGYAICLIAIVHTVVVVRGHTLMANPNEQSALLAMCMSSFFLLRGNRKIFAALPVVGVFWVGSFNGILAVGVVLFVYGVYLLPQYWYFFVWGFAGAIWFYWYEIATDSVYDRLGWWRDAMKVYMADPSNVLNGCGLGNWKLLAGQMVNAGKINNGCFRLHNTWIQSTVEMGIFFPVLVTAYVAHVVRGIRGVHIAHILGVVAFLVVSSTNSLFRMNIINGMIAIALLVRLELEIRCARNA